MPDQSCSLIDAGCKAVCEVQGPPQVLEQGQGMHYQSLYPASQILHSGLNTLCLAAVMHLSQGKLQKANQQREYAKAFHADVLKKLAQEEAAQHEAAAARSRLASLRNRLTELQGMNADRRQRAEEVLAQVQELKVRAAHGISLPCSWKRDLSHPDGQLTLCKQV